ncbi:cellulose synthase [Rhizobiaceae sp. 2RAB30]
MKPPVIMALAAGVIAVIAAVGLNRREALDWTLPQNMLNFGQETDKAPRLVNDATTQEPAAVLNEATPPSADEIMAQAQGQNPGQGPGTSAPAPTPSQEVDETALRYFARQGDTKRLQAEIARLRALYPQWRPPADPLAVPPQGDPKLDAIWKLYSEAKYAEARKAIADRQAAEPTWQPPKDLLERLDVAESRERLINASDLKQYQMVIRVASQTPSLLTCSDIDVLWRVAEAFALTDAMSRAEDAYGYILKNCDDPAARLATVEKAIPLLPRDALDNLFALERPGADGKGEFQAARIDLVRRAVGDAGKDPQAQVRPEDVAALEAIADADGQASDALLLGWLYVGRKDFAKAEGWFAKARKSADSAEASQGLALALIALQRPGEAEDVPYPWRTASDDARKTYLAATANLLSIEPPVEIAPAVLERIVAEAVAARDTATAQQLGWYARSFNQHETAGQWFSTVLQWKPDDEPSAYGLALTRLQLGDRAGVAEIQRQWARRSERIAQLGEVGTNRSAHRPVPSVPAGGTAGPAPEESRGTVTSPTVSRNQGSGQRRNCTATDLYSQAKGQAALARGWCLMDLNRPAEAAMAFEAAMETADATTRRDAAWGQSLAYLRSGLTDQAAVAAAKAPQSRDRSVELQTSILTQRATSFFEAGRYTEALLALDQRAAIAPERLDLMVLRGYAYLGIGRRNDAKRVFEALAASGDREGVKGLATLNNVDQTDR